MKKIVWALLALTGLFVAVLLFNTLTFHSKQINIEPIEPIRVDESAYSRLSEAIQFRTVSILSGRVTDSSAFLGLHDHITSSYHS